MRKLILSIVIMVMASSLSLAPGCGNKPTPVRPNVMLISIDTLRADHLGCYGYEYERDTSPNIDEFAGESVLFKDAYSPTCWTAPAHMSMFTSLYPSAHGVNNYPIPARLNDDINTLTQSLKLAGYSTHGQYYGHYLSPELGFEKGFDSYVKEDFIANSVDKAIELLDGVKDDDKPFFLFLHVGDVHAPYMDINKFTRKTAEYSVMFDPGYSGPIKTGSEEETLELAIRFWDALTSGTMDASKDIIRDIYHLVALYDGAVRHTDNHLGRFFKELKEMGLYDNTLIVFTSDHGEEFGEHNNFGHNQLHRELIRVPLIIKFPESYKEELADSRVGRVGRRVTLMDIMPTVMDVVGTEINSLQHGRSLIPLVKGELFNEPVVYGESEMKAGSYQSHWSVLDGDYHALRNEIPVKAGKPPVEHRLYNSKTDIREKFNLASKYSEKLAEYDEIIASWQKSMKSDRTRVTKEASPGAPAKMSEEQKQWLKSLGYIQ